MKDDDQDSTKSYTRAWTYLHTSGIEDQANPLLPPNSYHIVEAIHQP